MSNNITEILHEVQKKLKVPKDQKNTFGGYKYRSNEDILEAVKKVLPKGVSVIASDEMVVLGERYYVKATVSLIKEGQIISSVGYARESEDKKGMDDSQITGTASSYARKYAANGLFAIDDTKDADTDAFTRTTKTTSTTKTTTAVKKKGGDQDLTEKNLLALLSNCKSDADLNEFRKAHGDYAKNTLKSDKVLAEFKELKAKFKKEK